MGNCDTKKAMSPRPTTETGSPQKKEVRERKFSMNF